MSYFQVTHPLCLSDRQNWEWNCLKTTECWRSQPSHVSLITHLCMFLSLSVLSSAHSSVGSFAVKWWGKVNTQSCNSLKVKHISSGVSQPFHLCHRKSWRDLGDHLVQAPAHSIPDKCYSTPWFMTIQPLLKNFPQRSTHYCTMQIIPAQDSLIIS